MNELRGSATFDVAVPRARVFAFLSNPRNLIDANHEGPVVEQSDGPLAAGSWYVLAFHQLRARIEYTAFEPHSKLAVSVALSGRFSGGVSQTLEVELSELAGGRTRMEVVALRHGGWRISRYLSRLSHDAYVRRMRARIAACS